MLAIARDVLHVMNLIRGNPLFTTRRQRRHAVGRFLAWQLAGRVHDGALCMAFVNHTQMLVRRRLGGRLHYVLGMAEFDDMAFIAHMLRAGDVFADVGANIGAYTLLAASTGAQCVAFEPAQKAFDYLSDNVALNRLEGRVAPVRSGVGAVAGRARMTSGLGEINHILPGETDAAAEAIDIVRLDDFFQGRPQPTVIKVDVEGFETDVIAGARHMLRARGPTALLLELGGHGARYGHDEAKLHDSILSHGYTACRYDGLIRRLARLEDSAGMRHSYNVLYVRDFGEAQQRLRDAPPIVIGEQRI